MGKSRFQAPGVRRQRLGAGDGSVGSRWQGPSRDSGPISGPMRIGPSDSSDRRVRSQSEEHLLSAFRLLLTAYCVSGLYYVPERGYGVYTLGYDAISELKSRRNQLSQEASP